MEELDLLEQHAVDAAINSNWDDAIALNKKLISRDKNNLKAYLRLGFAYIQTRKFDDAEKVYKKALKMQPKNVLARDNLDRIHILKSRGGKKGIKQELKLDPGKFLETPGKTKSVGLVTLGQKSTLAHLHVGERVELKPKRRKIEIRTENDEYVGSLPDDLSHTLYIFISGGNEYSAYIKEVSLNRVVIFIREEKKAKKFQKYASFPKAYQASIVAQEDGDDTTEDEEESVEGGELENMAESLSEEKVYLPYSDDVDEEESDEE